MRRLTVLLAAILLAIQSFAYSPRIRDIDITVRLEEDGSALITERWDVCVASGTEWYLVRSNLGDIQVTDLRVSENGMPFVNEGAWDVDRSLAAKAGRCGIVQKSNGVEICWGVGSMGDHLFDVSYRMSNCVKSMDDYDVLHMQFVSPGLSAEPGHVRVTITGPVRFGEDNSRIWGFGYEGSSRWNDGSIVLESSASLRSSHSVIALVRLDKGIFSPTGTLQGNFQSKLDRAMNGADFGDDEDESLFAVLMALFVTFVLPALLAIKLVRVNRKRILGMNPKEVSWFHDIPAGGDLEISFQTLKNLGELKTDNTLASAMILRMIYKGFLSVSKDSRDRIEISFNDGADLSTLTAGERGLFAMMQQASGSDRILQDREFSRWSARHNKSIRNWIISNSSNATAAMQAKGIMTRGRYTPDGQKTAREIYGFKKYLDDFTISGERSTAEVTLWREYLVFASLFGIADKVAKELKDINPQAFDDVMPYEYHTMRSILRSSDTLARSITNAQASAASSGMGGHSSIGGGGGFSGGGFGGGSR